MGTAVTWAQCAAARKGNAHFRERATKRDAYGLMASTAVYITYPASTADKQSLSHL